MKVSGCLNVILEQRRGVQEGVAVQISGDRAPGHRHPCKALQRSGAPAVSNGNSLGLRHTMGLVGEGDIKEVWGGIFSMTIRHDEKV